MNINHLLQLTNEQINKTKIHFATGSKSSKEALYVFLKIKTNLKSGRKGKLRKILREILFYLLFIIGRMNGYLAVSTKA